MSDQSDLNRLLGERLRQQRVQAALAEQQARLRKRNEVERRYNACRDALIAEIPRMVELLVASNYPVEDLSYNEDVPRAGLFGALLDGLFGCHQRLCVRYGWEMGVDAIHSTVGLGWGMEEARVSRTITYLFSDGTIGKIGDFPSRPQLPQDLPYDEACTYFDELRNLRTKMERRAADTNNQTS